MPSDDVKHVRAYRLALFRQATEAARGIDGAKVILALQEASEALGQTGVDEAYDLIPHPTDGALYPAFDITWLTLVLYLLRRDEYPAHGRSFYGAP